MPFHAEHTLLALLIVLAGAGMFIRLIAKEKHRRDNHLEWRLMQKTNEDEEAVRQKELGQRKVNAGGGGGKIITLQPMNPSR